MWGKRPMKNLLKAVILLLDEVLIVVLVFLILWKTGVSLSWEIIITVIGLTAVVIFIVYRIIVSLTRRDQVGAREGMIGLHGRVVSPLTPEGTIKVHGEIWKAKCTNDDSVSSQEEVIIMDVEGLTLLVKQKCDV